jgi:membrane protease YdiL (CAAX protease family)
VALGLWLPAAIAGVLSEASLERNAFYVQYFLSALQEVLMIGVPAAIYFLYDRKSARRRIIKLKRPDSMSAGITMLSAVSFTMAGSLLTAFWVAFLMQWGYEPSFAALLSPVSSAQFVLAVLLAAFIPAVVEELLFRGVLLKILRDWRGDVFAVIATSLVFSALHFSLEGFPVLLIIGLAIRRGSLILPMLFHFVYNASAIAVNAAEATPKPFLIFACTFIFSITARLLLRPAKKEEV